MNTVRIPLTRGQFAIIDAEDAPLVAGRKWQAHPRRDGKGFYAANSEGVKLHRFLLCAKQGQIVDHRNGDGLDNRRGNIRIGSQSGNCVNRQQTPGVYLRGARPKKGKWQAYIKFQGKQRSLGYFDTEREAHDAYVSEARRLHGDWMSLPAPPRGQTTAPPDEKSGEDTEIP